MTLGEDASHIRTRPGMMARIRSVALNILRANAISFEQLLALGIV